jgi:hypothetical protein
MDMARCPKSARVIAAPTALERRLSAGCTGCSPVMPDDPADVG